MCFARTFRLCCEVGLGLLIGPAAWAQPVSLVVEDRTDPASPPGTRTCNLVVHFDQAGDVLLVQSMGVQTTDPAGFYQVTEVFGTTDTAPQQLWINIVPEYAFDSFVDIGVKVRPTSGDQTTLTQEWDSAAFNCVAPPAPCGQVIGGWYNAAPDNGLGHAEAGGDVFIAQFTVGATENVSGTVRVYVQGPFSPPLSECPDLNGDGVVNAFDLLLMLGMWGPCDDCLDCIADLNGDCVVDVEDLAILLSAWWLPCELVDLGPLAVEFAFQCFEAECLEDEDCADGNPCTDDVCDAGACVHSNNSDSCDDGDACTLNDVCLDGVCHPGEPQDCDDDDLCTADDCDEQLGCVHQPVDCNDGDVCTSDGCDPGSGCTHDAVDCSDGNVCTMDSCDPQAGCIYQAVDCNDDDACTEDRCDAVLGCQHDELDCDDGITCTIDSCNPESGCVNTPDDDLCDDSNLCTEDVCDAGQGCTYTEGVCSDGDTCTSDVCNPASGCLFPPCAACPADLNGDGNIDAADLAMLLGSWGDCPD